MIRPSRKITIRDVAARAGVSVSTVSLALNHPDRVSAATRERVLAVSDALSFVPKEQAIARARRSAKRVGVIGPFASYPAAMQRLSGILTKARGESVDVVVFDEPSAATSPAPLLAGLPRTGRLDGLLIVSLPLDDVIIERIIALELPAVLIDTEHERLSSVTIDDEAGGKLAGNHLLELGHGRLAFLGEAQTEDAYTPPARRRLNGYRQALRDNGCSLESELTRWAPRDLHAARRTARELLDHPEKPSAVFASDDLLAAAVIHAAHQLGLSVPGDLAVIGYDDTETADALKLTTISQPLSHSGAEGLRLLRERMRKPTNALSKTTLRPQLIDRDST
ncbi:LacI family DNA-binding transcriptional regulator [Nesterenkonia ebinurensis]|uniref:LacI family DNA-binding transcriptional regulator n=1 Tax=Nesterenkonia ebinurensis TaxID=2608252 RepID=UPI00123CE3D5|nr:LacI family DNA-binding transcriptional regulator [Nesterenkonia ebinurensis]